MANRQDNDNSGPNPLMIFAVLSAIFVLVVMIAFVVLIFLGAASLNQSSSSNGPYNVVIRPIPDASVSNAAILLPKQIGGFQRGPLTGTLDNYKATYKSGDYQIDISGSQAISVGLAQAYVNDAVRLDSAAAIEQRQLGADPSFYITSDKGAVHYVWSHYRWFFDVKANSQTALDEFMKVFKY